MAFSEIKNIINSMVNAWNDKDVETYMSFFHPDALIKIRHSDGRDEYVKRDEYQKTLPERMGAYPHTLSDLKKCRGCDPDEDIVVTRTILNITGYGDIEFMERWKKLDGKWLLFKSSFGN